MAEAMVTGLLRDSLIEPGNVVCSHPREERRRQLHEQHGVRVAASNLDAASGADIVLLGIKPQVLSRVTSELRGRLGDSLLVSIVAGASSTAIAERFEHGPVVRAMPNAPAQIGQGVTVWFATDAVSEAARDQARLLLGALGKAFEVADERQVAMATALSGTGPAYVFLFLEALIDAGVHLGFPRHVARELVLDTVVGSGNFALQSGQHVAALRDVVTSPGGTTAEALYELESGRFRTVISDAVWAAYSRTLQLEAQFEGRDPVPGPRHRPLTSS
jgi:pyrroline-5-carboxylate reductase